MNYKIGSIVEVRVKDEHCNDIWRCAEIVSRNGHNYTVSYDVYPGFTHEEDVEHLSGKFIRPRPPILEVSECWLPGDEVEVFHDLSWKMAIIVEDCSWDGYLVVRVVGSLEELEVVGSELRVPLSYQNGEWVDADGAKRSYGGVSKENAALLDFHLKESGIVSSKTRKRASPCYYTQDEENEERPLKFRVSGKEARHLIVLDPPTEKVDDVIDNRDMKENINGINGSETDSVVSSCASCSANGYKPYDMYCRTGHDSDAESTCQSGYHEDAEFYHGGAEINHGGDTDQSDTDEAWADEIRRQELNAYQSTLEALYASGPLTWEKEAMGQSTGLNTLLLHQLVDVGTM